MSLRVVHVVRQYHPSRGGMEDVVANIARAQASLYGHQPRVVTLDRVFRDTKVLPPAEVLDGIPVRRLAYRGSERYPLYPGVLHELGDADVVHVHGIDFAFDYLSLTRALHKKPLLASTHGGFFHTAFAQHAKKVFFHTMTRCTARGYRRIIASSANDGEVFGRVVPASRIRVIENGVDIQKFDDASSPALVPTLIYVGRWSSNKGLPRTISLLAALRAVDPRWRLVIAGREYDLDRAALESLAQGAGVADAVTVMPNPDNAQIREAMSRASYFVCLSRHEGFGLAAIEAMSAGLVPVLSRIPPFERLAGETQVPLVVDDEDAKAAQAVLGLHRRLEQHGGHSALRERAMASIQHYSWRSVVAAYVEEYERAAAAKNHSRKEPVA